MEKLRPEVLSLASGPSVPGPKEGSGQAGTWTPGGLSRSAPRPLPPMRRRLRTDWLYSWTRGGGYAVRPEHAHTGVGDFPCHNHDTRRPLLDRAGWGTGHGTAWLLVLV